MKIMFIQYGMGVDLHGQDVTTAAVRAVRDAIQTNSMPGMRSVIPSRDLRDMLVRVKLGVPADRENLDVEKVKAAFPYGRVSVEVVPGGLATTSGVVLPDKGDRNDLAYIVVAAVEVGYEEEGSA
ncbi:MAG: Lin0512 family protein [Alicyclobacillaceae bacterium]|nr:Lin0512 family protein [Alicyclobacillaceae bacterium]